MNARDIVGMDRELAFPIYACVYPRQDLPALKDFEPGRIVLSHYNSDTGKVDDSILDGAGPNDIVFIPLYGEGNALKLPDRWLVHDLSNKLALFDENVAIIKELAPRVKGILVGNAGPEMSFKEKQYGAMPLVKISDWACEFIKETADIIIGAGGRPVYGTVDWDVAIDCYFGCGSVRDLCNEIGALQICFCGFQLFGLKVDGHDRQVPHPDDKIFWQRCPKMEEDPWPELTDYVRGTTEIWSGVNTTIGLARGFDVTLKEHGFDAGVMGPPGSSFASLLSGG